jgi:hypothetical protein
MWFKKLTGFNEESLENVREKLFVDGSNLVSRVNGNTFRFGELKTPTLDELKAEASPREIYKEEIRITEIVRDVQLLHADPENENALFQVASQFNLLEMVGPEVTPERGVDIYEHDYTQGPACAIACGAGTIYRNYFAPLNGRIGQSFDNQFDCLELIGKELNNDELKLWTMRNGYALASQSGLEAINTHLSSLSELEREALKGKLKIGLQWSTEVTFSENRQLVSQAFCSALPVAYSHVSPSFWEDFARLILEATYEATLCAALINLEKTNCNKVYLTLVGGGAFGNSFYWITESLTKALEKFRNTPLDVRIVSYGKSNERIQELIAYFPELTK